MSQEQEFTINPTPVEETSHPIVRFDSKPLTSSKLAERRNKKPAYFTDAFNVFRYNFHKETTKTYLRSYISRVMTFNEQQKIETVFSCRFPTLQSSEEGDLYFLRNEKYVISVDCNNEDTVVIPEKREGFLLYEADWDDKLRLIDEKMAYVRNHPATIVESPSNHPNYFSYKKGLLVSWTTSFLYFYNLFGKIHSKPIPHSFDIVGLTLGKFETVYIADKRSHKIIAFNIFNQSKRDIVDYPFSSPCLLTVKGDDLFIENSSPMQSSAEKNVINSRQCRVFNLVTQKSIGMEGIALYACKNKPLCYFINKRGALTIKNYRTGLVIEETKTSFKPIDMIVSHNEEYIYFFAINLHPLSDTVCVVCWDLRKKKIRRQYDLNYAPTHFFVNKTETRILHWEAGDEFTTMEELNIINNDIIREFTTSMDKVDFEMNVGYFFENGCLYKLNLDTNERKLILSRGDHIFRKKGDYYFVYSPGLLAIFNGNDECIFDDFIGLVKRLKQIRENEPLDELLDQKSIVSENGEFAEEQGDKVRSRLNSKDISGNHSPDKQSASNPNADSMNERYDRLVTPQLIVGRKNIASLVRFNNPNMEREFANKSFVNDNDILGSIRNLKIEPTESNWIYFLDYIDSEPPAFYFINYENYHIIKFEDPKLQSDPCTYFFEDRINDARVSKDQIFIFTSDMDGVIKQWNLHTFEKLKTFPVKGCYFELSNDDKRLYILNKNGWLYIVDIERENVIATLLIDPRGITESYPSISIHECSDPNEVIIHYANKLKKHYLRARLNVWEYQYIKSFFKENKSLKQDEFISNIVKYKYIYKKSSVLQDYFNPVFIAALYSLSGSLETIFGKNLFHYPFNETSQMKPLLLTLYNRDLPILEMICEHLISVKNTLFLSYEEMILLLHMDYPFTKNVLVRAIQEINTTEYDSNTYEWPETLQRKLVVVYQKAKSFNANSLEMIKNNAEVYIPNIFKRMTSTERNSLEMSKAPTMELNVASNESISIPARRTVTEAQNQRMVEQTTIKTPSKRKIKIVKSLSRGLHQLFNSMAKKKVSYFLVTGKYNFQDGSQDSKYFLSHYSKSQQTNFILSRFRLIIIDKWSRLGYLYKIEAFLFLVLTVFLTLCFFISSIEFFFFASIVLLGFYLFYEGLSFYVDPKFYFKNPDNILDVLGFSSGTTVLIITYLFRDDKDKANSDVLHLFQVITMLIYYYRLTTYMKAFDTLNPIITMIYAVAYDIWDILLVFIISVFVFTILHLKANSGSFGYLLATNYVSFYGELPTSLVTDNNYVKWIVVIASTFFITLVMANFIIARMNNNYSRMEERQIEVTLKEKARLLLEFETLLYILPKYRQEINSILNTKYYAVIAQDTNIVSNYEDYLQSKIENSAQNNAYLTSLNQEIVQNIKRLNDKITKVELKNKEIIQNLKQQKSD